MLEKDFMIYQMASLVKENIKMVLIEGVLLARFTWKSSNDLIFLGDCDTIKSWNDINGFLNGIMVMKPCCLRNWSLNLGGKMAKKNVNRAKQYNIKIDIFWKAVATVTAAVKEAPKRLRKLQKQWRKKWNKQLLQWKNLLQVWKVWHLIVRKHSMMKVFALLRTSQTGQKRVLGLERNRSSYNQEIERTRR